MKKIICFVLFTVVSNAFATEQSAILNEGENFTSSYVAFDGEFVSRDLRESDSSATDPLSPVGAGNASSLKVSDSYCVILADKKNFAVGSQWQVFAAGNYSTLGNFDNRAFAIAAYKMIRDQQNICSPKDDIPTLYSDTNQNGSAFPLVVSTTDNTYLYIANRPAHFLADWVHVPVSLSVPTCYQVQLAYDKTVSGGIVFETSPIFGPGKYNLSNYNFSKKAYAAVVTRDENCTALVKPKYIVIPVSL